MSLKLIVLKTGENLVSEIKEAFLEDKLACYILENPYSVIINGTYKILNEEDESEDGKLKTSVSFKQWPVLSKDVKMKLECDAVVTIVEPLDEVKNLYQQQIYGDQNESHQSTVSD